MFFNFLNRMALDTSHIVFRFFDFLVPPSRGCIEKRGEDRTDYGIGPIFCHNFAAVLIKALPQEGFFFAFLFAFNSPLQIQTQFLQCFGGGEVFLGVDFF